MFVRSQRVDVGLEFFFDDDIHGHGSEQERNRPLYLLATAGPDSGSGPDHLAEDAGDLVDLRLVHDQWRRQRDDVAGTAHQQPAVVEAAAEHLVAAAAGGVAAWRQLHRTDQPEVADIDHVGQPLQGVQPLLPTSSVASAAAPARGWPE
ncbi:hypothetical protein G6F31_019727 [Rhizopus arrhizus]|nr:hypothetical protein G6F31_019727 [Rhizopus arrhizus]